MRYCSDESEADVIRSKTDRVSECDMILVCFEQVPDRAVLGKLDVY
jgi:hypothetical protein